MAQEYYEANKFGENGYECLLLIGSMHFFGKKHIEGINVYRRGLKLACTSRQEEECLTWLGKGLLNVGQYKLAYQILKYCI